MMARVFLCQSASWKRLKLSSIVWYYVDMGFWLFILAIAIGLLSLSLCIVVWCAAVMAGETDDIMGEYDVGAKKKDVCKA